MLSGSSSQVCRGAQPKQAATELRRRHDQRSISCLSPAKRQQVHRSSEGRVGPRSSLDANHGWTTRYRRVTKLTAWLAQSMMKPGTRPAMSTMTPVMASATFNAGEALMGSSVSAGIRYM